MKKKWIAVLAGLACCAVAFTGCRESTRARYNVQKQADYFTNIHDIYFMHICVHMPHLMKLLKALKNGENRKKENF